MERPAETRDPPPPSYPHQDSQEVGSGADEARDIELRGQPAVLAEADEGAVEPAIEGAVNAVELKERPSGRGGE